MEELGFTKAEFDMLKESEARSNHLVDIETRAMNAVAGRFMDENGRYSVIGQPDAILAINLTHSKEYHAEKAKIMEPIDKFFVMLKKELLMRFNLKLIKLLYILIQF